MDHIQEALFEYEGNGLTRRVDIQYRAERINLKVVTLRPELLFLNHTNSRIRVELEAHPEYDLVMAYPQAERSQEIIASLLKATPEYGALRDQLNSLKQRNPGIVSIGGRVINGNTRLVALRELAIDGFDAGVLPASATEDDFKQIELGLQFVSLKEQKYSFVNQLRQFEIMLPDKPRAEIFELMGFTKQSDFEEFSSSLSLVNEFSLRGIPKTFFNEKREYLKVLGTDIAKLRKEGKFAEADNVKEIRLIGMLCDASKDEVRNMHENFLDEYLKPRTSHSPSVAELFEKSPDVGAKQTAGPLDDLFPTDSANLASISDGILKLFLTDPEGDLASELAATVRLAGEDAIHAKKKTTRTQRPIQLITSIHRGINDARAKITDAVARDGADSLGIAELREATSEIITAAQTLLSELEAYE